MVPTIPSIRDRLWLLAHDERRGLRACIDIRALEVGLTGATVIDLLLQDRIHVRQGRLHLQGRHTDTLGDPVCAAVEHLINAKPDAYQAPPAPFFAQVLRNPTLRMYERTAGMLIAAGVLIAQPHRRYLNYRLDPPGINQPLRAEFIRRLWRAAEINTALDALCALVLALNLHHTLVLPYSTDEAGNILRHITRRIPERVGPQSPLAVIPDLAIQVQHTIGDLATAAF